MAFRAIDWQCDECGTEYVGTLTWVDYGAERPRTRTAYCEICDQPTKQSSLMGCPAKYMGETTLNPRAFGGACDTMGFKELNAYPEMPGAKEHSAKMRERLRSMPDDVSPKEKKAAISAAMKDAPSSADYSVHINKPEWQETWKRNERIAKQNKEKKKRTKALCRGETVNFRRDKCAGDPKL